MSDTAERFGPWQQLARLEQQMDQFLGRPGFGRRAPAGDTFLPSVDGYVTGPDDGPGVRPGQRWRAPALPGDGWSVDSVTRGPYQVH